MRYALSPQLQGLLRRYALMVVEPLIDGAIAGTSASAHIQDLLKFRKKMCLLDPTTQAFWRTRGHLVRREYRQWLQWLRVTPLNTPPALSTLGKSPEVSFFFVDLLYGAINNSDIWTAIAGEPLNRRLLCQKFLQDLGHSSCSYCDIDTVRGSLSFEHFVPRNMCPYLAVAPENLYVACNTCNGPQLGKGRKISFPVARPDSSGLGLRLRFEFSGASVKVETPRGAEDANVATMLKLSERYADPNICRDALKKAQHVYESASRADKKFSLTRLLRYHEGEYAHEALYFVTRAALGDMYMQNVAWHLPKPGRVLRSRPGKRPSRAV